MNKAITIGRLHYVKTDGEDFKTIWMDVKIEDQDRLLPSSAQIQVSHFVTVVEAQSTNHGGPIREADRTGKVCMDY